MEVRLLGPLQVVANDRTSIDLGGPRQRRLLSALALEAGTTVSEDRLVDAVWPPDEAMPDHPRRALQTYVSRLRSVIGSNAVRTDAGGYALGDVVATDVAKFERLAAHARRAGDAGDTQGAEAAIAEALALWRGEPFEDLVDVEWSEAERRRLAVSYTSTRLRHVELLLDAGALDQALPEAEALVTLDRFDEGPRRALMLALYRSGRQADAIRAFQAYRATLADQTGLEPSADLVELERMILSSDPRLDPEFEGRRIRGYVLGERIAEGTFSDVYRGVQPSVDREVAIKVVRPELADAPDFVRLFESEARTVARLEHPHIVPVIDFWREPGNAYLVMRYLAGGSAAQRLARDGAWPLHDVTRLVDEIGGALATAHAEQVVHGDVKPENVLFDELGNCYLTDFGIAAVGTGRGGPDDRSSAYWSPERRASDRMTEQSDIFSFATLVCALLVGSPVTTVRTALAADRAELPDSIAHVLRTATAVDPDTRYRRVEEFVTAFITASTPSDRGPSEPTLSVDSRRALAQNPFRGLSPFGEADEALFFGRDHLTSELVTRVEAGSLVALVGPSGSGKSSVVQAGVVPQLRADGAYVVMITPGRHPMDELENALLAIATEPMPLLLEQLVADRRGLARAIKRLAGDDVVVVVIDQFEELFALAAQDERDHLLGVIAEALRDPESQLAVIATIRADALDRPLLHPEINDLLRDGTVLVPPLGAEELGRAVTGPLERCGLTIDPPLLATLVGSATGRPGALPLLQYTLTELFDRRDGSRLTLASYDDLGGIDAVVAERADQIYLELPEEHSAAVRRLFLRLVVPVEGGEVTRQKVRRSELGTVPDDVVTSYVDARLLTMDRDSTTREPTVEISHDALLTHWPRLREWIEADEESTRALKRVAASARAWAMAGRADTDLLRGGRLEIAEGLLTGRPDDLSESEQAYVTASIEHQERVEEEARAGVRRLHRLLTAVAVVAAAAILAGIVAWRQRDAAEAARSEAETRRVAAESLTVARTDRRLGLLMAVEAYRRDPSPATLGAIQRVMVNAPTNWMGTVSGSAPPSSAVFLDDDRLAISSSAGVEVVSLESGTVLDTMAYAAPISEMASAPSTGRFVVGAADGTWTVFEGRTLTAESSGTVGGAVLDVAISGDGAVAAVLAGTGITMVDLSDGGATQTVDLDAPGARIALDSTGDRVAVAGGVLSPVPVVIVEQATGAVVPVELPPGGPVATVAWRGDDLLALRLPSTAMAIDPETGAVRDEIALSSEYGPTAEAITGDGWVAALAADGSVEYLADGDDTPRPVAVDPQVGDLQELIVAPDGQAIGVVGNTGVARYSTLGSGTLATAVLPGTAGVPQVALDDAAGHAVTGDLIPGVPSAMWSLEPSPIAQPLAPYRRATSDRDVFLLIGSDSSFDAATTVYRALQRGDDRTELPLDGDFTSFTFAISPDGRTLVLDNASDSTDGTVRVVDVPTGEVVGRLDALRADADLEGSLHFAADLEFTPDGERLVVTSWLGSVHVYDTSTWELVAPPREPEDGFTGISFSNDGEFAITHDWNRGELARRDPVTLDVVDGPVPAVAQPTRGGTSPDLTSDARLAVVSGGRAGVTVYDVATLTPIGDPFPFSAEIRQGSLAADAAVLATVIDAGAVLWNLDVDTWVGVACRAAAREMSAVEYARYGLGAGPDETCSAR